MCWPPKAAAQHLYFHRVLQSSLPKAPLHHRKKAWAESRCNRDKFRQWICSKHKVLSVLQDNHHHHCMSQKKSSHILLSVSQTELMRVMWIMFFIRLRIWAWFNSTEINGSLSIHLNEPKSAFVTSKCKTLCSFCLTEVSAVFRRVLGQI